MLTIIMGPPCSGKTTWVTSHRRDGDIVIDFDTIAQALGGRDHDCGEHIRKTALDARDAAITTALACHQAGARVWIIDSKPRPGRRREYQRHRARFIALSADPAELHRRATAAGRPADTHRRIDAFTAAAEPQVQPRTAW